MDKPVDRITLHTGTRVAALLCCWAFCLSGVTAVLPAQAQVNLDQFDVTQINVDDLSDEQILRFLDLAQARGYSLNELEKMALARGMRLSEVRKLRARIRALQSGRRSTAGEDVAGLEGNTLYEEDPFDLLLRSRRFSDGWLDDADSLLGPAFTDSTFEQRRRIFGEELFTPETLTFAPSMDMPTPENYQLGPGDELVIAVWGAAEKTYRAPVSRDGTVRLEGLGPIYVNGFTIEEAEQRLLSRLSQLYAGLNASEPSALNTYADVTLGKVRTITVHILGEVKVPGSYQLPSLSTVFNALYVCAGPNESGTYRSIQVIRGDHIVGELDVYDFLVYGSQRGNIRLRDQDIIKVDPYLARVEIEGEIKRPALFEIKRGETLADLIRFAGAFTEQAYTRRLKVYRNTATERRLLDVLNASFEDFQLHSGDKIFVGKILDRFENRVEVRGAVYREGEYELGDVETVYGLIQRAEGLKGDAFTSRGHIYRTRPDQTVELLSFDLSALMRDPAQHDMPLQRDDVVIVPSIFDLKEEYVVEIEGSVQKPGEYSFMQNMTLQDLIVMAGGLKDEASLLRVEVARRVTHRSTDRELSKTASITTVELDENLTLNGAAEYFLQPFDKVYVRKSPNYIAQRDVVLTGEVMYPGSYTIESKDDRISDMIERAGGLTAQAYPRGARLIRRYNRTGPVGINLEQILSSPRSAYDLLVETGDSIHVPLRLETVKVSGAVYAPASIPFTRQIDLLDYINRAGGATDQADLSRTYVIYANGSVDRVRKRLLLSHYPRIEPGAEIVVPVRPEQDKMSSQERIAIFSAIVSMAAVVSTAVIQIMRL